MGSFMPAAFYGWSSLAGFEDLALDFVSDHRLKICVIKKKTFCFFIFYFMATRGQFSAGAHTMCLAGGRHGRITAVLANGIVSDDQQTSGNGTNLRRRFTRCISTNCSPVYTLTVPAADHGHSITICSAVEPPITIDYPGAAPIPLTYRFQGPRRIPRWPPCWARRLT